MLGAGRWGAVSKAAPRGGRAGLTEPPGGEQGRAALLAWFQSEGRDLPWRRTRDRWAVLVSETMLRQTQANRVAERFPVLLAAFPSPSALAEAPLERVLSHWEGLGYYRRARDLWRSAQVIVEHHDGVVPGELQALLALPGVGRYTARAVVAFADGLSIGPVDTNVRRVLSRWAGRALSLAEAEAASDQLCQGEDPWSWNQAVMELGACCCTARAPRCNACPLLARCPSAGRTERVRIRTRQPSPFAGSDRQGAARLLRALLRGPVGLDELASVTGFAGDAERARRVAARLLADGMAVEHEGRLIVAGRPDGDRLVPGARPAAGARGLRGVD